MNAAISGLKGYALIVDGETVDVLHLDGRRSSAQATHVRGMLDQPADACFIECDDLAEVRRRLQEAADAADALQLTLIALDLKLSGDTRREACGELTELFEIESNVRYVERILHARPLGLEHDLHGAKALASPGAVGDFFDRLDAVQHASMRVEAAWEQISENMFVETRRETFARLVQLGLVRDIIKLVATGSVFSVAVLLASNPRAGDLDDDRSLLTQWLTLVQGLEEASFYDYSVEKTGTMVARDGSSEERAYKAK